MLGDTGRLIEVGDVTALARTVGDLLASTPTARRELGRAGRERIMTEFTLERMVERFEAIWDDVLAHSDPLRRQSNEPVRTSFDRAA